MAPGRLELQQYAEADAKLARLLMIVETVLSGEDLKEEDCSAGMRASNYIKLTMQLALAGYLKPTSRNNFAGS